MLLLADPWLHNLDPFAIQLPGFVGDLLNGGIRWYGLSYLLGFVIGYLLVKRVLTVGLSPMKPEQAADLAVTCAIGIVVGGRLGYVAFYRPELFIEFTPDSFPWWGALKINEGGMASHGGMLGGIGGCLFFAWRHQIRPAHLIDLAAFGAPLGLLMGRIANFINGELFGRECPRDFPLAVQFPQEMEIRVPQEMEIRELWGTEKLKALQDFASTQGELFQSYADPKLIQTAMDRVQAGDPAWSAYLAQELTPRYPSQLFAGFTEGIVVFAVLLFLYRKPVKAGLIGGWFCMTYALMRVVNEFFRLPDLHLMENGEPPLVTRGQALSIGLFLLGVVIVILAQRSKQEKLGGWMPVPKPSPSITEGTEAQRAQSKAKQ